MFDLHHKYDAIVIGARCAGASTAMLLARHGARVLMIDRAPLGSDTLSTHALMRGAVMQLQNWDVLPQILAAGTPSVRRTSFIYGDDPAIDIDLKPSHGTHALYAPRRTILDRELAIAAKHAGVTCRFGLSMSEPIMDKNGAVEGAVLRDPEGNIFEVRADILIGADGRKSQVAEQIGAATLKLGNNATRCIYGYFSGLADRGYRWHWGKNCGGGIIPTNDGNANVFLSVNNKGPHDLRGAMRIENFRDAIRQLLPSLAVDLKGATLESRLVGFAGQPGHLREASGDGWALVGDAAYFKDPITAHGITDALRDAQLLADNWSAGRIEDYEPIRDALSRDIFRLSDEIAGFDFGFDKLHELHESLNLAMQANQLWIAENLYSRREAA